MGATRVVTLLKMSRSNQTNDICSIHGQLFTFFCSDCDQVICNDCIDEHSEKGHKIKNQKTAMQIFEDRLKSIQLNLTSYSNHLNMESSSEGVGFGLENIENYFSNAIQLSSTARNAFEETEINYITNLFQNFQILDPTGQFEKRKRLINNLKTLNQKLEKSMEVHEPNLRQLHLKSVISLESFKKIETTSSLVENSCRQPFSLQKYQSEFLEKLRKRITSDKYFSNRKYFRNFSICIILIF